MNYMKEVAKILGVEVNEDFELNNFPYTCRITDNGFTCSGTWSADILMMLLNGDLTINRKPWKPKHGDDYYCVSRQKYVLNEKWYNDVIDNLFYKIGNCYRTREEAEANCDKWIAFYESDDVLEV